MVHDILFRLLHRRFGLSETVFDWIASFFHHRRYFVSTGKYSSKHHSLQFGVPQGSVLGPLLSCLINHMFVSDDKYTFVIPNHLKQSKPGVPNPQVVLESFERPCICVER